MWTLHSATDEHWVPISTIASFKRMRDFETRGTSWLATALRTSAELEVSEDGARVRRRTEVQEPKGAFERSVYAVCPLHEELSTVPSNPATNSNCRKALVRRFQDSSESSSDSLPSTERWRLSVCGALMEPKLSRYVPPLYTYCICLSPTAHRAPSSPNSWTTKALMRS